ncbi:MAG: hypothetical protein ACKO7R_12535 [Pseudanabaena sp.]
MNTLWCLPVISPFHKTQTAIALSIPKIAIATLQKIKQRSL